MNELEKLYSILSREGYYTKSFDEFKSKYNEDDAYRDKVFSVVSRDGFFTKSKDEFFQKFAPVVKEVKKKEDGESLSQEDTTAGDFGFYSKANETAFKEYAKTSAAKYQEVIKSDPTLLIISDDINAQLVRTRDRLIDAYNFDPNFDSQDPVAVEKANEDITTRIKAKAEELYNANPEYKSIYDKYQSELEEDLKNELQERLTEEARDNADIYKDAFFKTLGAQTRNPLINLFGSLSKGEGLIPIMGDAIAFQIPQAFEGWGLKNDSLNLNKMIESTEKAKSLDDNAPVYLNNRGELINPAEYGGQMAKDLREGTLPESSVNGNLMTAQEALAVLTDMQDSKVKEMQPKWEKATEMQEFISRINQVKPLSEDASFSNIIKTLVQQVPNMGVAMVMPVVGTAILEGGNTYLEQVQEIARQRFGEDATIEDILSVVESGEDGAAEVTGAAYASGLLDIIGLGGIGSAVSKTVKTVGKQVLKEGLKQGLKKVTKSQAYNILKATGAAGLSEGITEGLQGANMQFSRLNTVDKATGYRPDFDVKSVIEEGFIGFLMGGLMGGAGGVTTSLVNRNKANLPETVSLELEEGERIYFFGNDAITRKQAKNKISKATTLKELEKVRVSNDDILAQEIETKKAKLQEAKQVVEETLPEVAPEEIVETEDTFTHQTKSEDAIRTWANSGQVLGRNETLADFDETIPTTLSEKATKVGFNRQSPNFQRGGLYSNKVNEGVKFVITTKGDNKFIPSREFMNVESFENSDGIGTLRPDARSLDNFELYKVNENGTLTKQDWADYRTAPEAAPDAAKKTFNPKGFYEAIDEQGNPIVSFTDQETGITEFESSETPQLSASKTIGGAITGLFSMRRSTGQKPSGAISIYKINSKPDVEINPVNIADFAFIDEVRYNSTVEGTEVAKIELDEDTIDFLTDFYNSFEATEEEYDALLSKYNANDRTQLEGIFKERIKSIYPSSDTGYFRAEFTSTEVAPEVMTAEDKPVEEVKPVKTPEMEELESEIATLQSDIETYEIEAENTQEEIDIEKGNLKDALADIDARIKEVRESKQSAAAKRDAIEELKAEKQDIKDDNASLIEGYREDIKNAKREAKKAATRIKRLSTKLEGLAPVQPTAEPVAEQETKEPQRISESFIYDIYNNRVRVDIGKRPDGKYFVDKTRDRKTGNQGEYSKLYDNIDEAIAQYKKEIKYAESKKYSIEQGKEGEVVDFSRNTKTVTPESILKKLDEFVSKKAEPTKKVVGTLEVEEEEEVTYSPIKKTLVDEVKALDNQLEAEFITDEEYAKEVTTALNTYQEELNKLFAEGEPTAPDAIISAEDSQADMLEFEKQSPKLRFTRNLLRATRNFRGTTNLLDLPMRVVFYKTEAQLAELEALLEGRTEAVAGGFYDLDSNTIILSEETAPDRALVHEFTHPIAKRVLFNNKELANKLAQEALQIPGIEAFVKQYTKEGKDVMTEEAIVDSVARAALKSLQEKRTIPQRIKDFFMRILDALGLDKGIVIGNSKSSLEDFIKNISEAFATGRKIRTAGVVARVDIKGVPVSKIKLSQRVEIIDNIPIIKLASLEGKTMEPVVYDNLRTGDVSYTNPITRNTITKKDLMGGVLHPFLKGTNKAGVVAAFTSLNKAVGYATKIQQQNIDKIGIFLSSKESSLYGNREIRDMIFDKGGIIEDILTVFNFKDLSADLSSALQYKGKSERYSRFSSDVFGMKSMNELVEYVQAMDFATYRKFFELIFPQVTGTPKKNLLQTKYGLPTRGQLMSMATEDITTDAKEGDLVSVVSPEPIILVNEKEFARISARKKSELGELGIMIKQMPKDAEHTAYPYAIAGKADGVVEAFVNARNILPSIPEDASNIYYYAERRKSDVVDVVARTEEAMVVDIKEQEVVQVKVSAAPYTRFETVIKKEPTVKDVVDFKNSKAIRSYRKLTIEAAKDFNLIPANLTTNVGVWESSFEPSNTLEVKGEVEAIRAYAAYMGLYNKQEIQDSIAVSSVRMGGESLSIDVVFRNSKDALAAANEFIEKGIVGLSYDLDKNIITIFVQDGDTQIIENYYAANKSKIQSVQKYEADVEFIGKESYAEILREYRSKGYNQGAGRENLRNRIDEALGESPTNPFGQGLSRIKHTKATRQNIIRPSQIIQQEFEKRYTPKRIGSKYYQDLEILRNVDLEELGLLTDNSGTNIGIDLVKEYNKVMPDLIASTMPVPKQLEPALALANKIKDALDYTTHDKVVQYSSILLAHLANDPSSLTSEKEVLDAFREAYVEFDIEEFTEADEEFIKANIDEIRQYASDVYLSGLENKKFSERMGGTIYEGREALIKNDITRSASAILARQREELAKQGYKNIDVEQLELSDSDMDAIAEKLGGGDEFAKILKSNRKSINNTARNDLRNQNVVDGLIEISKRNFKRGVIQKYMNRTTFNNDKVLDKVSFLVKPEWTQDEITVLKDYMEYHEVKKLFQAVQSLQHGYLPPMSYGIIRKLQQATNAIKLAEGVGNMTIMTDANGRIIRDRVAVREARQLTELAEKLAKLDPAEIQKRTTSGAMPYFQQVKDKTIARFYNEISKAFSMIESQREIDIANYNEKYSKIKPIIEFEGEEYTNADVNIIAHQYLIEKQYLSNPGSERVPKLYDSLIKSITNLTNAENKRYIELFNKFKLENNTLDIQKVQSFLKRAGALNEATQESGMAFVNYVEKRMKDSRVRVRHLQEFQNKTKVETFENYIYVATKAKANTGEAKVDLIESLLNTSNISTLGFAKTSITRQSYRKPDGTHKLLSAREPVFDLMFAANFATNEVLNAYHLGETFRDIQAQLNILAKMGDTNTQVLAQALKNDVRARIINSFEYKMSGPSNKAEKALQQLLSGTYTAYLASARRFVELVSNAYLVGMANPSVARALVVNAKDNIGNATMSETRVIMDKIGSAHKERFNKTGKAFYTAEGIGAERLKGQTPSIFDNYKKKDGRFRTSYKGYLAALNKLGEMSTGIKNFADKIVRMSDTKIGAVAWNTVFKDKFQELTGVEYNSEMINDETLFIQYRASMIEAGSYADVFLKQSFAGNAFDMNQRALRNTSTMKYLQNMFRTFRTFFYESNRDAVRSLLGYKDGTMEKEEAIRRLAGASGASVIYAIGTTALMNMFFEQLFSTLGLGEDEEEDKEFEIAAKNAVMEFIMMTSLGRLPAIQYGLISGATRATIRYAEQEDITGLDAFNKYVQRLSGSNYLLRQTVPVIGEPIMLGREVLSTSIDAFQGDIQEGDANDLFLNFLKTAAIYKGIPFSGDFMSAYYTYQKMQGEEVKASTKKTKYKPKYKSILE